LSRPPKIDQLLSQAYAAHQARRVSQAEKLYQQVLRTDPSDSDAANLLGLLYIESQRFEEARDLISMAVRIQPDNPQSHYNLGIAAHESGDAESAIQHFAAAASLAPQNSDAWTALGNAQKTCGELSNAIASFRNALRNDDSHSAAGIGLSDTLNDLGADAVGRGNYTDAKKCYGEAIALNPNNAQAFLNLGMLLEQLGDENGARDSILASIRANPRFGDAHFQLAHLKIHKSSEDDIALMKDLFADGETSANEKAMLAFGIGKALDKQTEFEQEFEWLTRAHEIMHDLQQFDLRATLSQFDRLQNVFTKEFVSSKGTINENELLFVIGMPRSGTSLAEQILASHTDVYGAGEQMTGDRAVQQIYELCGPAPYPEKITGISVESLQAIASSAFAELEKGTGGERIIVDTTPSNFMHVGLLAMVFPRARFVLCTRHPLDTCMSIYQHPLSAEHAYANGLDSLGAYFMSYQRLVDHWAEIFPDRIYVQKYEDIVGNLHDSVASLLAFCDLDFDEACVDFHKTQRIVKTPSASQVRQPIYASSIGRWKRYSKQLEPLKQQLASSLGKSLD
jgi:tetratricopeptide (TPR) repeat protein